MKSNVPQVNLVYGTSQLQGAKSDLNEGDTLRILFKADGDGITNIKDSTLNFQLLMPDVVGTFPMLSVNNSTVASIFQV